MAEIVKKVKDCTCHELQCENCPWCYKWEITETGEVIYDKKSLKRCVKAGYVKTMQQNYDRFKDQLTPKQQAKIKKKLDQEVLVKE